MLLLNLLILWPKRIAGYFLWAGPLVARLTVGYTFMCTGWLKLQNLDAITEAFISWGIPFPQVLTPFVSGLECFGGAFLMLGLLTRISAGGLAVTMVVAILAAQWSEVDSLQTLLGLEEMTYFAVFTWLAIGGAGAASLDHWIERRFSPGA
jgi:putative oxidoreductase